MHARGSVAVSLPRRCREARVAERLLFKTHGERFVPSSSLRNSDLLHVSHVAPELRPNDLEPRQRRRLSREGSGNTRRLSREGSGNTIQRQWLSREGSGNTRQRQCRSREGSVLPVGRDRDRGLGRGAERDRSPPPPPPPPPPRDELEPRRGRPARLVALLGHCCARLLLRLQDGGCRCRCCCRCCICICCCSCCCSSPRALSHCRSFTAASFTSASLMPSYHPAGEPPDGYRLHQPSKASSQMLPSAGLGAKAFCAGRHDNQGQRGSETTQPRCNFRKRKSRRRARKRRMRVTRRKRTTITRRTSSTRRGSSRRRSPPPSHTHTHTTHRECAP